MTLKKDCAGMVPPYTGPFCPDIAEKIIYIVRRGLPPRQAAARWGVDADIIDKWIAENPDFARQIRQAEALDILFMLKKAKKGARAGRSWIWKLERRYPHLYAPKKTVEAGPPAPATPAPAETGWMDYDPAKGVDLDYCNRMAAAWQRHEAWVKENNLVWDSPSQSFIPNPNPAPITSENLAPQKPSFKTKSGWPG